MMGDEVMEKCLNVIESTDIPVVDITGGAPEMHPRFRELIERGNRAGKKVMSRCNLTIMSEDGYGDLPDFYSDNGVEVIASLPYFREEETDAVRGRGVYKKSISALKVLNEKGYGAEGSGLVLDLVFNPAGAYLPPPQKSIESDFKRELLKRHGIVFNNLFAIINMPIGRFGDYLRRTNNYEKYMEKLVSSYNRSAAENVMCRTTISVGWDGKIYDCDFNQMLGMPVNHGAPSAMRDFDFESLMTREIMTGPHCYGCTAGAGSSCGGATA
jgi:radical SAM/Cys-rich protein